MKTRLSVTRFLVGCLLLALLTGCTTAAPETPTTEPTATLIPPTSTPIPPTLTTIPPNPTTLPPAATQPAFDPDSIPKIDAWLSQLGQEGLFHGAVLVAHQGEVVLVQGYGLADRERETPITPQSRFRIASMTKQFTAMAILILQSQDKLDVFDLICNYIDDCPAAWKDITIHHLLTHTSGFPRDLSSSEWRSILATNDPSEQTMARFKDLHLAIPPGEEWYYSNIGYIILGSIIEQTSGQSYETFLQESIFSPLNMRNTGYQHSAKDVVFGYSYQLTKLPVDFDDTSGIINAAGGLYSTVEDLYLWDQVLYTEQLLPQAQLDQMFAPHKQTPDSDGWAYGYGWVIGEERGRTLVVHNGESEGFRSLIARYPDEHITIILLSNQGTTDVEFYPETISKKIFGES